MAFSHGTLAKLYAYGYDLSSWLKEISGGGSVVAEDATTLGKLAKVYLPGLADGTLRAEGLFDGVAAAVDERLAAALGAAETQFVWLPAGDGLGYPGNGLAAIETAYDVQAAAAGLVRVTAQAQSNVGWERGLVAHALAARTTTADGTALDHGAASAAGAVGYLQVTAAAGTGGDVVIEDSADNITFAPLITFANVTLANLATTRAQRIEVSGAVKRYVRAQWTVAGGDSLTFLVLFARKYGG